MDIKNIELRSRKITKPKKIVAFGDTHIGEFETPQDLRKIVKKINAQSADIVVFLGDLFDNYSEYQFEASEISDILGEIDCETKIAVFGNHDVGGGAENVYKKLMTDAGFTVLRNESFSLDEFNFIGAEEAIFYHPDIALLSQDNLFNFVIAHEPDIIDESGDFDLMISGHTHGGQIALPFYGALVKPPLGKRFTSGLYEVKGKKIYVNRGIGTTQLPLRFFARPEITVLSLNKAD